MTSRLVDAGTFVKLNEEKKPNSFWAASDPDDVARVEERTFICTATEDGAGPTNNWVEPAEMKSTMTDLYRGSMRGRTMYVIPFCMGPVDAEHPMLGVEITDSEYVVASMKIMTRMGADVLPLFDGRGDDYVKCLHSVGAPLDEGQADVAVAVQRDQVHLALPRDPRDLELRLRLRRQRAAGQEVLRAAHRVGHRARRGLARRAHADPQADLAGGEGVLRRRRVPERLRQDQPRHAAAHGARLARRDRRRRHRLDALRRGRPPLRRQPRVRLLRRRARHQLEDQPQRHAHDGRGQLDLHQHRAHRRRRRLVGRHGGRARST